MENKTITTNLYNLLQKETLLGNTLLGQNSFSYAVRDQRGRIELIHLCENNKICRTQLNCVGVQFYTYFILVKDCSGDIHTYINGKQDRIFSKLKDLLAIPVQNIPELIVLFSARKQLLVNNIGETFDMKARATKDKTLLGSAPKRGSYKNQEVYLINGRNVLDDEIYVVLDKHLRELDTIYKNQGETKGDQGRPRETKGDQGRPREVG